MRIKLAKYKIFLGKGVPPPCNHIRIHFDRKGTEIVHLYGSLQIHILLRNEELPLATTRYYTFL